MRVIFLPEVRKHFDNLIPILYEKGYFGFKETAKKYVDDLFNDIETNLPIHLHKPASEHFNKYGKDMEYAGFRKNKNTVWYVFFQRYKKDGRTIFLVRYIANNHSVAQYL
jgi:hypothetical protein